MNRLHMIYNDYLKMSLSLLLVVGGVRGGLFAQERIASTSSQLRAYFPTYTQVLYRTDTDIRTEGLMPEQPFEVGMDVAWDSEDNVVRGTNYIGKEILRIGRVSFQPSDLVDADGNLSTAQKNALQTRLNHIARSGVKNLILNCDHEVLCNKDNFPNCDQNYKNYHGKPQEWYRVIKATVKYCQSKGFTVVTISPFNEPDYTNWKEGSQADFKAIAKLISEDSELAGIRISAGNTLNCDKAASWYSYMKPYVQEGNTHQLAGSFDNYAGFWQTVRKDGNHATADEMHNIAETFIGIHYGLQSGVWWGWDGQARGELCHAAYYGKEIGYGENRANWAAGSVYKRNDGRIDAFLGVSERQATTTDFEIVSLDCETYYDGYGPLHSYALQMPGGSGYATEDQRNAERMVQIHYGEDVPYEPIVDSTSYVLMNEGTMRCFGYYNGAKGDGIQLAQSTYNRTSSNTHQRWLMRRVSDRIGGDNNYWYMRSVRDTSQVADVLNWSTSAGGTLCGYKGGLGTNEQWAFEYAGHGAWYIRSRHSGLYLEVKDGKTLAGTPIVQSALTGKPQQRWRFIPINAALEKVAPAAPTGLKVEARIASAYLSWSANTESDLAGYMLYRGRVVAAGDTLWSCIGRMLKSTEFLDNDLRPGALYHYRVRAIDASRNLSEAAESAAFTFEPTQGLVARYSFDDNLLDSSLNGFDAVSAYSVGYDATQHKEGTKSALLSSKSVQLPAGVANSRQMTVATWVKLQQQNSWQRIFDFGNGTDQYIFLTPSNGSEMRFVMKNGGDEEILSSSLIGSGWNHVAVTVGDEEVVLYVNGEKRASSTTMKIRPADICPVLNYIGRSQFSADPLMKCYVDDFRIYNYSLPQEDVKRLMNGEEASTGLSEMKSVAKSSACHRLDGTRAHSGDKGLQVVDGRVIFRK